MVDVKLNFFIIVIIISLIDWPVHLSIFLLDLWESLCFHVLWQAWLSYFFPIPNSFCTANFMDFLYPIYHSLLVICITHICAVYGHLSLMNAFILRIENSHSMPSILFILHRVCGFEIIWKTSPSITFIVFACIFEL